jgi:hypothetical protein
MVEDLGLRNWVRESVLSAEAGARKVEAVDAVLRSLETHERRDPKATLRTFLQRLALDSRDEEPDDVEGVTLMTIHAAKGLEFPVVFIIGFEEDLLPVSRERPETLRRNVASPTLGSRELASRFGSLELRPGRGADGWNLGCPVGSSTIFPGRPTSGTTQRVARPSRRPPLAPPRCCAPCAPGWEEMVDPSRPAQTSAQTSRHRRPDVLRHRRSAQTFTDVALDASSNWPLKGTPIRVAPQSPDPLEEVDK